MIGNLYIFDTSPITAIEWVVVREHPDNKDIVLLCPIDTFPFAGSPDWRLNYPNVARCGECIWVDKSICKILIGSINSVLLHQIRRKIAELATGNCYSSNEQKSIDFDCEYEDWMSLVRSAGVQISSLIVH